MPAQPPATNPLDVATTVVMRVSGDSTNAAPPSAGCQVAPSVDDQAAASLPIRPTITAPVGRAAIARPKAGVRPGGSSARDQCSRSVEVQVTPWKSGKV